MAVLREPLAPVCVLQSIPPATALHLCASSRFWELICSRFQGCCKVKHSVLYSSGRMEQCKELLFFCYSFLPSDRIVLPSTSSSITGTFLLCSCPVLQLLTAPVQTLLLHPSVPRHFPQLGGKRGVFLDQTAAWCLAMHIPGVIAVYVLPEVRKPAGKVISDASRDLKVSGHWDQKLELQLVAVGRRQLFWALLQRGGL